MDRTQFRNAECFAIACGLALGLAGCALDAYARCRVPLEETSKPAPHAVYGDPLRTKLPGHSAFRGRSEKRSLAGLPAATTLAFAPSALGHDVISGPSEAASSASTATSTPASVLLTRAQNVVEQRPVSLGGFPGSDTGLPLSFGGDLKPGANCSRTGAATTGGGNTFNRFITPSAIPIDSPDGEAGHLTRADESNTRFKTLQPSDYGDINAYLDLKVFAFTTAVDARMSDSHARRLRGGHGSFGPVLVGQTWMTFINASAIPDNLDFLGAVGTAFARHSLVRRTQHLTDGWNLMIGASKPEATLTAFAGERLTPGNDHIPDIVLVIQFKRDCEDMQLSLLGRQLRIDEEEELNDDALAGGDDRAGRIISGKIENLSGFFPVYLQVETTARQVLSGSVSLLSSSISRTVFAIEYIFARRELKTARPAISTVARLRGSSCFRNDERKTPCYRYSQSSRFSVRSV